MLSRLFQRLTFSTEAIFRPMVNTPSMMDRTDAWTDRVEQEALSVASKQKPDWRSRVATPGPRILRSKIIQSSSKENKSKEEKKESSKLLPRATLLARPTKQVFIPGYDPNPSRGTIQSNLTVIKKKSLSNQNGNEMMQVETRPATSVLSEVKRAPLAPSARVSKTSHDDVIGESEIQFMFLSQAQRDHFLANLPEDIYQFGLTKEDVADLPEQIRESLHLRNSSMRDLHKWTVARALQTFARGPNDTGSPEATVVAMTMRIMRLTEHLSQNKKDMPTKRRLLQLIQHRRKMMRYLKRVSLERFYTLVKRLALRPNVDRVPVDKTYK